MESNQMIFDKAYTDIGAALYVKGADNKYSYFMGVTSTGPTGAAPEQVEVTTVGKAVKVYTQGKKDSPQRELGFYGNRDSYRLLNSIANVEKDFLQVNPDNTGFTFSGFVSYFQDDVTNGGTIDGKMTVTVTKPSTYVDNVTDIIKDTAYFASTIEDSYAVTVGGTKVVNVVSAPSDATLTAVSETTGVATVSVSGGAVTVTGVAAGTAVVELTVAKTGYASMKRTFIVEVTAGASA